MTVPFTRSLPYVLREELDRQRGAVAFIVATVVSAPDNAHVVVSYGGTNITVPRLASYQPVAAGQSCYLLVSQLMTVAIGTVKT